MPGMNRPTRQIIKIEEDMPEPPPEPPKKKRTHAEIQKLAHQDPVHDHDADMCSALSDENQLKSFKLLNDKRNEMYGQGVPAPFVPEKHPGGCCKRCDKELLKGDDVIEVPEIDQPYCAPGCFNCNNCGDELCEFNYYTYEGDVYCGRCHAEFFMPRCAGCDELIFDPTYTVAEGKKWHLMHFCCWVCDVDLCEKQYAKDAEGNPCCLPCYNDKYAVHCGTCSKPITAGERAMRAGEKSYHHDDACFRCVTCKEGLENKKCVQYNEELYCSGCYHKEHSPPCGRCNEAVRGEFVEVRGKRYHKTCFNCFECACPFTREEKKGAYPVGDQLLCYTHALSQRRAQIKAAKAKQAAEDAAAADAAAAEEEADAAAAAAETEAAAAEAAEQAELAASLAADEAAEKAAAAAYAAEMQAAAAAKEVAAAEAAVAAQEAGGGGAAADESGSGADGAADDGIDEVGMVEPAKADALGGVAVRPRKHQSFIRQGTRKVTAMPKMSRAASQRRKMTSGESASQTKAVADAKAALASGAADVDSDDDAASEAGGGSSPASPAASGGGGMFAGLGGESRGSVVSATSATSSVDGDGLPVTSRKNSTVDPFDSLWAGFSIPMKYSKFKLTVPGREILEIGEFTLIEKKSSSKCYLILATDVTFITKMVDDDCYELMCMPVQRDKSKAKLTKIKGVIAMKVKVGKWFTLKMPDEVVRSQWIGKLNAPIGFIPTKALN